MIACRKTNAMTVFFVTLACMLIRCCLSAPAPNLQKRDSDPWFKNDLVTFDELSVGTIVDPGYAALNWFNLAVSTMYPYEASSDTIDPPTSLPYARTPVYSRNRTVTSTISVDLDAQGYYGYSYGSIIYEQSSMIAMDSFWYACTGILYDRATFVINRGCNLTVTARGCEKGNGGPLKFGPYEFLPQSTSNTTMKKVGGLIARTGMCTAYDLTAVARPLKKAIMLNIDDIDITRSA